MTDTQIKIEGLRLLTERLGIVEAERFVALLLKEPADYTAWRQDLFEDMTIEEISARAMRDHRRLAGDGADAPDREDGRRTGDVPSQ